MKDFYLKQITDGDFGEFYSLLEDDFCLSERKAYDEELRALNEMAFSPNFILYKGRKVGYICLWNFESFVFVEHFAIFKSERGSGLGGAFIKELTSDLSKLLILEAEVAFDEVSKRRLEFYKRAGFYINGYPYVQPKYRPDCSDINMHILSFNRPLTEQEFIGFSEKIKNTVYKIKA